MRHAEPPIDIIEDDILKKYPEVMGILLKDQTTGKNIFWATNNYQNFGKEYEYYSSLKIDLISDKNNRIITPRILKNKDTQNIRIKSMAEVFTPAWVCNAQNNKIDEAWFQKKDIFNKELSDFVDGLKWKTNYKKIIFPKNKTWEDYVKDRRIEVACGEAPYITSRYDVTTGNFIHVQDRIGLLDRKLRVINENVHNSKDWIDSVNIAYQNTYAYEWQGDSLLLAREAMLYSFIENYVFKFKKQPELKNVKIIAEIISWNVWQMDGLSCVVPGSCTADKRNIQNIFGDKDILESKCPGCLYYDIEKHNGVYCKIKEWSTGKASNQELRFIDVIKNRK